MTNARKITAKCFNFPIEWMPKVLFVDLTLRRVNTSDAAVRSYVRPSFYVVRTSSYIDVGQRLQLPFHAITYNFLNNCILSVIIIRGGSHSVKIAEFFCQSDFT